ncbi:MAG: hypothetical protein QM811_18085 [Pirellulales bacterium]
MFAALGNYAWEINDLAGTAGGGWDLLNIVGVLDVSASSASKFSVNLATLDMGGVAGNLAGFSNASTYSWKIAGTTGGITNFAADKFTINAAGFTAASTPNPANFSIVLGTDVGGSANDLYLKYVGVAITPTLDAVVTTGNATFGNLLQGAVATTTVTLTNNTGGATTAITPNSVAGFTIGPVAGGAIANGATTTSTITVNTAAPGSYSGSVLYTAQPGSVASTPAIAVSAVVGTAGFGATTTTFGTPLTAAVATGTTIGQPLVSLIPVTATASAGLPEALHSTASIMMYRNVAGTDTGVGMAWRTRFSTEAAVGDGSGVLPGGQLISDVVSITGMINTGPATHGQTDVFALQMTYDQSRFGTNEGLTASLGGLHLVWKDTVTGDWINAVDGNIGVGTTVLTNYQSALGRQSGRQLGQLRRAKRRHDRQPRHVSRQLGRRSNQQHRLGRSQP